MSGQSYRLRSISPVQALLRLCPMSPLTTIWTPEITRGSDVPCNRRCLKGCLMLVGKCGWPDISAGRVIVEYARLKQPSSTLLLLYNEQNPDIRAFLCELVSSFAIVRFNATYRARGWVGDPDRYLRPDAP